MKYYKYIMVMSSVILVVTLVLYYSLPDLGLGSQANITPTPYIIYGVSHCLSILLLVSVWCINFAKRNGMNSKFIEKLIAILIIVTVWFYLFVPSIINNFNRTHSI